MSPFYQSYQIVLADVKQNGVFIVCFAVIEVICNSASYEYLLLILYSLSSLNSFFNVLILFFKSFIIK